MDKSLESSFSVVINASPQAVWKVLTDPDLIAQYLYGTKTETDWQMGSPISFSGEYQGIKYNDKGIVMAYIPYTLLAYDYWTQFSQLSDEIENYCEVSYHLKVKGENLTEFTWKQIGFRNEASLEQHKSGMPTLVEKIKELSEQ